jgi:hypothetical protein
MLLFPLLSLVWFLRPPAGVLYNFTHGIRGGRRGKNIGELRIS